MELKKASDFDQELLNLFDQYVHGDIDRRGFLDRAGKFAVGGVTVVIGGVGFERAGDGALIGVDAGDAGAGLRFEQVGDGDRREDRDDRDDDEEFEEGEGRAARAEAERARRKRNG